MAFYLDFKDVDCVHLKMNELKIRFAFYNRYEESEYFFANQYVIKRTIGLKPNEFKYAEYDNLTLDLYNQAVFSNLIIFFDDSIVLSNASTRCVLDADKYFQEAGIVDTKYLMESKSLEGNKSIEEIDFKLYLYTDLTFLGFSNLDSIKFNFIVHTELGINAKIFHAEHAKIYIK